MEEKTVVENGGIVVGDILNDFHIAAEYSMENKKKGNDERS